MTNGKYDVLDSYAKSEIQGGDIIIDLPSWSMIECWECGEPYQVTISDARKKKLKECVCSDCHQYMLGKKDSSDRISELEAQLKTAKRDGIMEMLEAVKVMDYRLIWDFVLVDDIKTYANSLTG